MLITISRVYSAAPEISRLIHERLTAVSNQVAYCSVAVSCDLTTFCLTKRSHLE